MASTFAFQPGGVAAGNVYTSWAALYAALPAASSKGTRAPSLIQIDDSFTSPAVIPAGAYNLDSTTFEAVANFNGNAGGAVLEFADGATITLPTGGILLKFSRGLTVQSVSNATPVITVAGATQEVNIYIDNGAAFLSTGTVPFMQVNAGFGWVQCTLCQELGDGTHATFSLGGSGGLTIDALGTAVQANAVTGSGANISWDSFVPGAQGAGVVVSQFDGYKPAVPGNWSPTPSQQSTALDQLAARTATVIGPNAGATGAGPSVAAGANAGSGAAAGLTQGNDNAGLVSLLVGTGPTAGAQFVLTFAATFSRTAVVVLYPNNANASVAAGTGVYAVGTPTAFTIESVAALTAGQLYIWNYIVLG